jgi:hypothetical protein
VNRTGRLLGKKATDPDEGGSPEGTPPKQIRLSLNKMTTCDGTEMSSHYGLDTSTRNSSEPFARNTIETSTQKSLEPTSEIPTQNELEMPTRDNAETAMPALAGSSQEVIIECPVLAVQPPSEDSGDSGQEQAKSLANENASDQSLAAANAHASKEAVAAAVAEDVAPTMKRDPGPRMSQAVCPVVTVFEDLELRRQQLREVKRKNQEEEDEEEEDEDVAWSLVLYKKEKNYALFW